MTAVALRAAPVDLWDVLSAAVRRAEDPCDERLVIADSKAIYSTAKGLAELERSVLASLGCEVNTLAALLKRLAPQALAEIRGECWYQGKLRLPVAWKREENDCCGALFQKELAAAGIELVHVQCVIVCPERFNAMSDQDDNKSAVAAWAVQQLVADCRRAAEADGQDVVIDLDKQGGRHYYTVVLQPAVDPGFIWAREEGALRSYYEVVGLPRQLHLVITPRAEERSFTVALASMISKYLRELLMHEFNAYWKKHVPGLKPTAGYRNDSWRFMDEIRPALLRLGHREETIWRKR
jgi:hypothetical protein